ncbi:unnamed protein product [Triticum turgidum subsp. durum]|uniref:Uncharacterized protein n=1 Tax=Triticum turgidum subsp. durum TaxID=4567 RepID=A0A9R0SBA9_TRITD|nr:unnamed protein product [Triticum turgidum subsp. durum]
MPRGAAKRRREPPPVAAAGERKLLPGEHVEVISFDPGLCGSWHQAVVIEILDNFRSVRYNDFVDDNGSGSPLVEKVEVSDAIDGKSSAAQESTRGKVRPVHPHQPLQVSDASYGLWVDALVEGSYWEGVIADHAEGSMERKVFFPDEGDERIMAVDQLRHTQDWDEVTGTWKPRGIWLFLQMLLSHEEKDGLPVSVRQIWYDLRSNLSLTAEDNTWMCGTESFWEGSLAALIAELRSVCDKPHQDGNQIGDSCRSAETSTSAAFQNKNIEPIVSDKLDSASAAICRTMLEFISYYRNNDRISARAKRESAKHYLKSVGWTFVDDRAKNRYCVSPDGKRFASFIAACEAYLAQKGCHTNDLLLHSATRNSEDCSSIGTDLILMENKHHNKLSTDASASWMPVQLDAKFSPPIASLLASYQEVTSFSQGQINETMRMKLKEHLLALGWRIVFKEDDIIRPNGQPSTIKRYRYKSPVGKTYVSFLQVLRSFAVQCIKRVKGNNTEGIPDNCNYLAANRVNLDAAVSRDLATLGKRKRENKSDVVGKYVDCVEADVQNVRKKKFLRSKAKKFLKSSGWIVCQKMKSSKKRELRYHSPHGNSYKCLLAACKGYLEDGYQKENNVSSGITTDTSIALGGGARDTSGRKDLPVSVLDRHDGMFSWPTCHVKSKKRKSSSVPMSHARVLSSTHGQILPYQHRAKTVLSLLVDKNILLPRVKLTYKQRSDGPRLKEGAVTKDGIKCRCCNELFTLESFEVHAGCSTRLPAAHIFLKDGRSLSQCLVELMGENKPKESLHVRLKTNCSDTESDSICSICNEGGEILLCDNCPSSFHHACVGLEATPEGSWYCPSCRCSICDLSDYDPDTNQFTEKTIMYCDQCEREYHVGCMRNKGDRLTCCPEGCWFCSRGCSEIFQHLQELIGKPIPTPVEGLSCTILRFDRENASDHGDFYNEIMAEQYGKLCIALDVLHECFVTIIEPRTRRDLSEDIVFNRESGLRRLNFRGFYTILLQKDGELISVGTFRVCGKKFAELPLIGTRIQHRRQGMCRLLMNELEKLLSGLGVERLILPAIPQLLETWTGSFGFTAMSCSERFELAESSILSFQGTTICQKILDATDHNPRDMSIQLVLNAEEIELGKNSIVSFERTTTCDTVVNNASNHSEELKVTAQTNYNSLACDTVVNNASNHSEELEVTAQTNYNSLALAENSVFSSWGTTICQKVSSNAFSHPEELNGSEYQLECTRIVRETLESDSQESTSVGVEDRDQPEPELLLEIRSNSSEEGNCAVGVPIITPNPEVNFAVDSHGQPSDQCSESCVSTEVIKPVAAAPGSKYKGKCYERNRWSNGRRKLEMHGYGVSTK